MKKIRTPATPVPEQPRREGPRYEGTRKASASETDASPGIRSGSGSKRLSFEEGVDTELGGVLYLINLWEHLELLERGAGSGATAWALLDVLARALLPPGEADPLWEVLTELDGRPPGTPPPAEAARLLSPGIPAVRGRLEEALGDGGSVADLLHLRARLHVGTTHVDLVARLDDVFLPARIAGLDRDPGWMPAFGRVVLFHFE